MCTKLDDAAIDRRGRYNSKIYSAQRQCLELKSRKEMVFGRFWLFETTMLPDVAIFVLTTDKTDYITIPLRMRTGCI